MSSEFWFLITNPCNDKYISPEVIAHDMGQVNFDYLIDLSSFVLQNIMKHNFIWL